MSKKAGFVSILAGLLLIIAALSACQSPSDVKKTGAKGTEGAKKTVKEATATAQSSGSKTGLGLKQVAVIETAKGNIVFELYPDVAPKTVDNFVKLANQGYYDGIKFHRVEPGFVIQGGDPLSKDNNPANDGTGGPGYTIPDEFNNKKHLTGTVAMAKTRAPNSAGSQFYITLAPQPSLDGKYTVFGQVIEGMNVVSEIRIGDVMNKVYIQNR